jgi:hypothetical protein
LNPDGTTVGAVQPVMHYGLGGRTYYVSRYGSDEVLVWALTDPLLPAQEMRRAKVQLVDGNGKSMPFNPPQDAPELNGKSKIDMTNVGNDLVAKAVHYSGQLVFVVHDSQDWFNDKKLLTSIRLVRLFVLGFPNIPTNGDPSYINRRFGKNAAGDNPQDRMYYGWPAVAVNKKQDIVVVYARSGATIYPEVRYSTHFATATDIRPSWPLKPGDGTYQSAGTTCKDKNGNTVVDKNGNPVYCPVRWGDTAGAALDPTDETGIWVAQQYANATGGWDIWVGKVFGPKPGP